MRVSMRAAKGYLGKIVGSTPLALIPVRVRTGPAKGARWTLAPFSANWRQGGAEQDVRIALARFGDCAGRVFWDMGAHFGIHTVGFAMLAGASGQVVAFEPDPLAFSRLSRHVRMNRLRNVHLFKAAASNKTGTDLLYLDGGSSNSHLKYNSWDVLPDKIRSTTISTLALDDILEKEHLRYPDFIKIDVQGHGGKAVQGCRKSIAKSFPFIVFSNHSKKEQEGITEVLKPLGYSPESLDGKKIEWDAAFDEVVFVPPGR